ncbi:hypothetical protein CXB51_034178 [Gossypium anomalum]|uniref:Cytochrome P450 n=1 Tax=Gossypium anomalum TaxID=47600 RepID=A0A8J5XWA3_9ROSI|nr:hypothetical protein CXB51_034178 [Gossypium anomalum]
MEIPIDRKSALAASSCLPHRTLPDLATKHDDFMRLQLDLFLAVAMMTTYECTYIFFAPYGTYWRYLRKICTSELLSAAQETKENSGFFVSEFLPSLKFLDVVSGLKHGVEKIHRKADRIVGDIVNNHKESRAKGRSEDEDKEDIFITGSETSATAIEWAMSKMIKNPRVMKKAQAEVRQVFEGKGNVDETGIHQLKYLKCVIKETIRLLPVVPLLIPKESSKSCVVNGFEIPEKTRVIVNAWAIGKDLNYWVEPEKFEPERFKLPGEMKQKDMDTVEMFGLSMKRKNDLVLVPSPYHASIAIA